MKISVACLCVFSFCVLYWAFDTSSGLALAEDAVLSHPYGTVDGTPENTTESGVEAGERNVINSDSDLEPSVDIHSSIEELAHGHDAELPPQPEYGFIEAVSQNSGVAHEVTGIGPGVIHTLADADRLIVQEAIEELSAGATTSHHNETPVLETSALTKEKPPVITESIVEENVSVEIKLEKKVENASETSSHAQQTDQAEVPSTKPKSNATEQKSGAHEEIPSFSEWTQKQLEEAERKKEQVNTSVQNQQPNVKPSFGIKKRWKNYASPDCGAKIIAANPEAVSPGSVLSSSRDEYKLNACTSRIWFIVELCEAIQAKKIDLANFELFSSSPKDFSISVSDRFPSRDWSSVGHFTAKDERDIQSFDLHPHLFGKFIKFEMHSHHGSEHYCPISLFRVYGTSEFEVLETENQVHANMAEEDDDDETLDIDTGEVPKNLFSSAKDAVISIVKKAAEVLGNKGNASDDVKDQENDTAVKYTPLVDTCTTPSHSVICTNCSDLLFGNVFKLLSCSSKQLFELITEPIIKNVLYNSNVCSEFGFEFQSTCSGTTPVMHRTFVDSFFPPRYIAAMCNAVAINECKVVLNVSSANTTALPILLDSEKMLSTKASHVTTESTAVNTDIPVTETVIEPISETTEAVLSRDSYTSQIKPTKTLIPEEDLNFTAASGSSESESSKQVVQSSTAFPKMGDDNGNVSGEKPASQVEHIEMNSEIVSDAGGTAESSESLDLDALVTELNGESTLNIPATTISPPTMPQGHKESVFLRLSNRIKALERNMSLSSQYLEELSRRYKKQVEEMQRLLDKTVSTLTEENRRQDERTQRLEEQIMLLREAVESLIAEKNSWVHTTYWVFLSGIALVGMLLFCWRNPEQLKRPRAEDGAKCAEIQRRKSVDVISHKAPVKKQRRPSEEALKVSGTYTHLMLDEIGASAIKSKDKKRKRKKQLQQLQRSNSITTLNEETSDTNDDHSCRTISSDQGFYFAPQLTSSRVWMRQESAPPTLHLDWIDDTVKNNRMQDIPFVLEDSEHSSLEPITFLPVLSQKTSSSEKRKENGNVLQQAAFAITATDSRSKRLNSKQTNINGNSKSGHKKSASFDESSRQKTPSPNTTDTTSLSNSINEADRLEEMPKKFVLVPAVTLEKCVHLTAGLFDLRGQAALLHLVGSADDDFVQVIVQLVRRCRGKFAFEAVQHCRAQRLVSYYQVYNEEACKTMCLRSLLQTKINRVLPFLDKHL